MQTTERFAPHDPLPRFLSDYHDEYEVVAEEHEPRESILLLNASILVMTTALISIAVTVSLGNPVKLLSEMRAPVVAAAPVQPDTSTTTMQATASTRGLPPVSTRDESPAPSESAGQKQADVGTVSGALLGQFEAWAARQDERTQDAQAQDDRAQGERARAEARVEPVRPTEDAPTRASQNAEAQDTQAPVRSVRRHRASRPVQNARAEMMRSMRKPAARVRRDRSSQIEARPAQQEARAPEQPAQSVAPASFTYWRQQ